MTDKTVNDASNHDLVQALKMRGCVVIVFSAEDVYDDLALNVNAEDWFSKHADNLTETLTIAGNESLDTFMEIDGVKKEQDET